MSGAAHPPPSQYPTPARQALPPTAQAGSLDRRGLLVLAASGLGLGGVAMAGCDDAPAGDEHARPRASGLRPGYHLSARGGFMNDPQRPVLHDGRWHLYYLFNADYPDGNGTSWFHVTSTDLVRWRDEGTAIEKYRDPLGDIESGSVVVDADGTAGFGEGALVAIMTQMADGVQRQSLFGSTDGGRRFRPAADNPLMDNPGQPDWRDPRVVRDDERGQWVMVLAEGERLGFYTSQDLRTWSYSSDFVTSDLGVLECPDLFALDLDGDPSRRTWVLMSSANDLAAGRGTGVAYWTGSFDGRAFSADTHPPRWVDSGPDFYAGVTWSDPREPVAAQLSRRFTIGWLNNWAYARELPGQAAMGNVQSVVREIVLSEVDGVPVLHVTPLRALSGATASARSLQAPADLAPQPAPRTHRLDSLSVRVELDVEQASRDPATEVRLMITTADRGTVRIGYDFDRRQLSLVRDERVARTTLADSDHPSARSAAMQLGRDQRLRLIALLDTSSVEVFAGDDQSDGQVAMSAVAAVGTGPGSLSLEAVGGTLRVHGWTVAEIAPVLLR